MNRTEKLEVARRTAAEGMVLLRNKGNILPLRVGEQIALFGTPAYFCHRMGFGSGDMLAQPPVQYFEGLKSAGIVIDEAIASAYLEFIGKNEDKFSRVNRDWAKWTTIFPEPGISVEQIADASKRCSVAVVVIGRGSGEAADRADCPGSFRLSNAEQSLVRNVRNAFGHVIVLLNVCGVMDLAFSDECDIDALLLTGLCGETGGLAAADILSGRVSPSGHLAATWAKRYRDYPTTDCFGTSEVPFHEGIYLGYRYFDTFGVEPRFPFGYGLSYTEFSRTATGVTADKTFVTAGVDVRNAGKVPGADTVQCYLSCPDGKLEKAYQDLCGYKKTPVIAPGASERVEIKFDLADFASFCEKCASYVLEKGDYILRIGDSSRNTHIAAVLRLPETVVVRKVKNRFQCDFSGLRLISKKDAVSFSYPGEKDEAASAPVVSIDPAAFVTETVPAAEDCPDKPLKSGKSATLTLADAAGGRASAADIVAQFDDYELASMVNGVVYEEIKNLTVGGMAKGKVHGEAAELWHSDKYAIPVDNCADGPSGVRLTVFGQETGFETDAAREVVAYPSGTVVAQTWNPALAREFGECVRRDMEVADIDGWLAPGVNLQRNPLCGRNFEYFSEDPLLSGLTGAAIVRGVQENRDGTSSTRYATVKHYAVNSQEFERGYENNIVSERALRELYLKSFRHAVREGRPRAVMTSYNRINGEYAATSFDLLNGVLRGEYGFDGMVMTDWWNSADPLRQFKAGNDLIMPGVKERRLLVENAIRDGRIDRADVQACAIRVLNLILSGLR